MALVLQTEDVGGTTYAKVRDGKVVYLDDQTNNEVTTDAEASAQTIKRLNSEAQRHREAKEAIESKLKPFEGLDPDAAKTALETVSNLESGQLLQANKVEEMKAGIVAATESKFKGEITNLRSELDKATKERNQTTEQLHREKLTNAFATSKFIPEKMVLPPVGVQRLFADSFKIEDGKIVAYGNDGGKLYSQEKPGQEPEFDEALSMIVGSWPYKDTILKGKGHSGGGGQGPQGGPNGGGNGAGKDQMLRTEFDKLDPIAQAKLMAENKVKVVDAVAAQ